MLQRLEELNGLVSTAHGCSVISAVAHHDHRFLPDGRVFDASNSPGRKPIAFKLGSGGVIKGWEEVLRVMNVRMGILQKHWVVLTLLPIHDSNTSTLHAS